MRVLSFIPAVLLAAASFVVAAPSCVPSGDDTALQPVIAIFANATTHLTPLCDQLNAQSGSPNTDAVDGLVVQVTAVIDATVSSLEAAAQVDLTGLDVTNLSAAIGACIAVVLNIMNVLITIYLKIGVVAALQAHVSAMLHAIIVFVGCLHVFVAAMGAAFASLIVVVTSNVNLMLSIVGGAQLVAGA